MRQTLVMAILCPLLLHCMPPRNSTPPLSVGDAFQAFTITNIINHTAPAISVPSSGNQLYILNFVALACRSCAKDYARLQALQQQYGNRMHIILVTSESAGRVDSFLKTNKIGRQLHLPIAASDTLLASWFPHRYLSHTVWLQNGTVKGITDPQYINENNIEILLQGRNPHWPVKNDGIQYNAALPLLSFNPKAIDPPGSASPFYSVFSDHINGLPSSYHRTFDSATASVKTTILNLSAIQAYLYVYDLRSNFPVSQIVLNTASPERYIYNEKISYKLAWEAENTFCYEAVLPSSLSAAQQQQKTIGDLDFYFGIHSGYRKMNCQCFALTFQSSGAKPLLTSGNAPQFISLSNIVYYLNHHWYGIPVFNETGITEKRYIPFNEEVFSDYRYLQPYLKQYGLQLNFVQKQVEMLILNEDHKP